MAKSRPPNIVRLSIEIPIEVNDQLALICPWGTKAESIRALIEVFLRASFENKHIATELMQGRCSLVVSKPSVQNLNAPRCEGCDE